MTVESLIKELRLKTISLPSKDREIDGVYIGDLLSWVMGRAESSNVWITIMSNVNVIAVATLTDVSCIIMAEGVTPDDEVAQIAFNKGVNVLSTELSAYQMAVKLKDLI